MCTCSAVGRSCEVFDDSDEVDEVAEMRPATRDLPKIISVSSGCLELVGTTDDGLLSDDF